MNRASKRLQKYPVLSPSGYKGNIYKKRQSILIAVFSVYFACALGQVVCKRRAQSPKLACHPNPIFEPVRWDESHRLPRNDCYFFRFAYSFF